MKRIIISSALCTLLCFTFGFTTVHAEESKVDMSKCITLTVKQGASIKLDFAASTAGVWVKVTGVKDEKEEEAPTKLHDWDKQPQYEAAGTVITVYGAIDKFRTYDNNANLTALDVSQNVNLTELSCGSNQLSSLDVSQNVNLTELSCGSNQLSSLDVSQNVNLTELYCGSNQLSSLDVTKNVNLMRLGCGYNQLISLDVSQNVNLTYLMCENCRLSTLDVSQNVNLSKLYCGSNQLSSLDVTKNLDLTELDCEGWLLSSLDVTKNVKLTKLNCSNNQLSSLNVTKNVYLTELWCYSNQLASLDVTKNVELIDLFCSNNQLSSLDVSQNVKLTKLQIYRNCFSTSTLNNIYCQLSDQTGGELVLVDEEGDVLDELLVRSTCKVITDAKNWAIRYFVGGDIEDITGNYTCGSTYGVTFTPTTIQNLFTAQGGGWKTMVTSTGNWKLDETTPLPDWLSVEPKQGSNGTQVTVTAKPNAGNAMRRAALVFVLTDDATTKQVVLFTQTSPSISVTPFKEYIFPAAGEMKTDFVTVESTGAWTVSSSNAEWFPVEKKEGEAGTTKVTIKTDANNSKDERRTELSFALKDNPNVKQVVTLKQKGASISVTPSQEYTFPYVGETKTFTVESSMVWTVTASNAEWLTIEPKSGAAGTATVTVKADANSNEEERSTELTFALKDNADVKQVVKVKQAVNPNAVEDVLFAGISVAPNPFSSQLKIKNEEAVNVRYELVNTKGVMVCSGVLQGVETELNTEKIPAGAYLLRILAGSESKTLRVVKE